MFILEKSTESGWQRANGDVYETSHEARLAARRAGNSCWWSAFPWGWIGSREGIMKWRVRKEQSNHEVG